MNVLTKPICLADARDVPALLQRAADEILKTIEPMVGKRLTAQWEFLDPDDTVGQFCISDESW